MRSLRVQVPATAANLGPGFDALALALNLHNEVIVEVTEEKLEIQVEGEGEGHLPTDASNMIARAAYRFFRAAGTTPPGMRIRSINRIPQSSGLGSSAAAIICGLMVADTITESRKTRAKLLEMAWDMEGHADNVAAAIFGGLTIVGQSSNSLMTAQVPIARMRFAVVVPKIKMSTNRMRDSLPRNVTLHDAALNLGRMGLLVEAFRQGDFDLLSHAAEDRLHEPYRIPQIPGFAEARLAGLEAGAAAVTLSGAGPGLIAFAPDSHESIADAMADVFDSYDLASHKFVLDPELQGARLLHTNH
jgi:homoserine kinase